MKKLVIVVTCLLLLVSCGTLGVPSGYVKNADGLYEKYDAYSGVTIISPANNFGYSLPIEFDIYKTSSETAVLLTATRMDTFGILSSGPKGVLIVKVGIYNSEGEKVEVSFDYLDSEIGLTFVGLSSGITSAENGVFIDVETAKEIRNVLNGTNPIVRYVYSNGKYDETKLVKAQINTALSVLNTL